MNVYECRITRDTIEEIELLFPKSAWFREGGDGVKIHYHGIIFTDTTTVTVRNKLKTKYKISGNGGYKVSNVKKLDEYLAYMSKNTDCVYNGTDIDFSNYKWVDSKKLDKVDIIFKEFEYKGKGFLTSHDTDFNDLKNRLAEHVMTYYRDNQLLINPSLMGTYCRTWLIRQGCIQAWQDVKHKIKDFI